MIKIGVKSKEPNLLKLWLSFFCLSLANALASDSVGKIHAVHVNEVIRIKVIQTTFQFVKLLWRKPDQQLANKSLQPFREVRRACHIHCVYWNPELVFSFTPVPAELSFPHFLCWLLWWERFPRRPWFSKVFEDNKLLKSNIPAPTYTCRQHAYVPHRGWTRGTTCLLHCYLHRMWSSQESAAPLAGIETMSFCGNMCTSPRHSRYDLSDLLKMLCFPAILLFPLYQKSLFCFVFKSTPLLENLRSQLFLTLVHTFITQTWAGKHITKLVIFGSHLIFHFPNYFKYLFVLSILISDIKKGRWNP